jgi:hypothetical protein
MFIYIKQYGRSDKEWQRQRELDRYELAISQPVN